MRAQPELFIFLAILLKDVIGYVAYHFIVATYLRAQKFSQENRRTWVLFRSKTRGFYFS